MPVDLTQPASVVPVVPKTNSDHNNVGAPASLGLGELGSNRTAKKLYLGTDTGVTCVGEDVTSIARGGTGATTAAQALVNLGISALSGSSTWALVTANTTLSNSNSRILANSTGGSFTLTLPTGPTAGMEFWIQDPVTSWATHNLTLDPGTENINSVAGTLTLDVDGAMVVLVYVDSVIGWDLKTFSGSTSGLTPASIGAVSTTDIQAYATTAQVAALTTAQINGLQAALAAKIDTSQIVTFATTSQIATLTASIASLTATVAANRKKAIATAVLL